MTTSHRIAERENVFAPALPQPAPSAPAQVAPPPIRQPPVAAITLAPGVAGLLNSRLLVIALLAIVGPLGLPALWFSPRFSRITKVLATSLFVLLTVVLPLAFAYYWLEIALRPLVDAFGQVSR